jgi:hypothetical protein
MWRYVQSTGEMLRDGIFLSRGYSGFENGKNNPAMCSVHDIGPIPSGKWKMTMIFDHPARGPRCIRLDPAEGTVTFGRDGFLIHGDSISNPGNASQGCIIMGRVQRELIWGTKDTDLEVVP